MSEGRNVVIKNMVSKRIVVHEPAYGVRRIFPNKGAVQSIPYQQMEQLMWSNGFRNLLLSGVLYIENMQDKIDLGLEEPGTETPTKIKTLNEQQMLTLLKIRDYDSFVNELATLSVDQANSIVDYAVANRILDSKKIDYLKEITGRDAIKILANQQQNKEIEEKIAEKEALRKQVQ